jgi:3-oxoacyl-[acyl-carrier protein] reductase
VRALEADGWRVATAGWRSGVEVTVEADLGDPEAPARVVAAAEEAVGPLTALVACHTHYAPGGLLEADPDEIDRHMAVNVRGTLLLCAGFTRRFGGEPGSGRIVTFVSGLPLPGEIAYAASKGAIEWLTISAAVDLGARGITANAIDPGPTQTGWMNEELVSFVESTTPLGRVGRPEDAATLVAFLLSPAGGWITGRVLRSDGGFSVR